MANGWRAGQQLITVDTDLLRGLSEEGIVHLCIGVLSWRLNPVAIRFLLLAMKECTDAFEQELTPVSPTDVGVCYQGNEN